MTPWIYCVGVEVAILIVLNVRRGSAPNRRYGTGIHSQTGVTVPDYCNRSLGALEQEPHRKYSK